VPTGAAFHEDGWTAKPAEIIAFSQAAKSLGLTAINWWEWGSACLYGLWDSVAGLDWGNFQDPTPAPSLPSKRLRMRVIATQLNIRKGPSVSYQDIGDLFARNAGDVVPLNVAGQSAWVKISDNPDRWVCVQLGSTRYLEPIMEVVNGSTVLRMRVIAKQLNIRSGPSSSFSDVGDLFAIDKAPVDVLNVAGADAWIKCSDNPEQWICAQQGTIRFLDPVIEDVKDA
jgi:uncharacterized protein YgiM (DUF1202 family)